MTDPPGALHAEVTADSLTVRLYRRHPRGRWISIWHRLYYLAPALAVWFWVWARGDWFLSAYPDIVGYHWMVPIAAVLTAWWVGVTTAGIEADEPVLKASAVTIDLTGITVHGERLAWKDVREIEVTKGRKPKLVLHTADGERSAYAGPQQSQANLVWVRARIHQARKGFVGAKADRAEAKLRQGYEKLRDRS